MSNENISPCCLYITLIRSKLDVATSKHGLEILKDLKNLVNSKNIQGFMFIYINY